MKRFFTILYLVLVAVIAYFIYTIVRFFFEHKAGFLEKHTTPPLSTGPLYMTPGDVWQEYAKPRSFLEEAAFIGEFHKQEGGLYFPLHDPFGWIATHPYRPILMKTGFFKYELIDPKEVFPDAAKQWLTTTEQSVPGAQPPSGGGGGSGGYPPPGVSP